MPFEIIAWVLLPDHMHCIWQLPERDGDFSKRWGRIKAGYSRLMKSSNEMASEPMGRSRQKRHESMFWQRRFWDHRIRDERDFQRHFDYLHGNPVKHGLVSKAQDWPWSSFHRYMQEGGLSARLVLSG